MSAISQHVGKFPILFTEWIPNIFKLLVKVYENMSKGV